MNTKVKTKRLQAKHLAALERAVQGSSEWRGSLIAETPSELIALQVEFDNDIALAREAVKLVRRQRRALSRIEAGFDIRRGLRPTNS